MRVDNIVNVVNVSQDGINLQQTRQETDVWMTRYWRRGLWGLCFYEAKTRWKTPQNLS